MVSLELVKSHLNILHDFEDEYIERLIEAAESAAEAELNINLCDVKHDDFHIVEMVVLQLVASMYLFREATNSSDIKPNYVFNYLKGLAKKYTDNSFG